MRTSHLPSLLMIFSLLTAAAFADGTITTNRPARSGFRNRNGGRYDADDLFNLYPQMSYDYSHDKFEVLHPGR